jgi:hypothetical protein
MSSVRSVESTLLNTAEYSDGFSSRDLHEQSSLALRVASLHNKVRHILFSETTESRMLSRESEERIVDIKNQSYGMGSTTNPSNSTNPTNPTNNQTPVNNGSLIDDYADVSSEMPDYTSGDD